MDLIFFTDLQFDAMEIDQLLPWIDASISSQVSESAARSWVRRANAAA